MSRRLRSFAVIAVAVALLAQTWLWIGVMGAPIGYSFALRGEAFAYRQFFFVGGALPRPGIEHVDKREFSPF